MRPSTFDDIQHFAQILGALNRMTPADALQLMIGYSDASFHSPAEAAIVISNFWQRDKSSFDMSRFKKFTDAFPDDDGIELAIVSGISPTTTEKLDRLKEFIIRNPYDPEAMVRLGESLIYGSPEASLAVLLESLERWPDNYRTWWGIEYGLRICLENSWNELLPGCSW